MIRPSFVYSWFYICLKVDHLINISKLKLKRIKLIFKKNLWTVKSIAKVIYLKFYVLPNPNLLVKQRFIINWKELFRLPEHDF